MTGWLTIRFSQRLISRRSFPCKRSVPGVNPRHNAQETCLEQFTLVTMIACGFKAQRCEENHRSTERQQLAKSPVQRKHVYDIERNEYGALFQTSAKAAEFSSLSQQDLDQMEAAGCSWDGSILTILQSLIRRPTPYIANDRINDGIRAQHN